jgi:hypothetical protein
VVFVFSALTCDRRVIWLGTWMFAISSWVGQDYFSPQAFAFFLYLVTVGLVVRWLTPAAVADAGRRKVAGVVAIVLALVAAIAVTHVLTSLMVVISLAALVVFRVCAVRTLPLLAGTICALWAGAFAHDYVARNVGSTLGTIRLPWQTAASHVVGSGQMVDAQQLVSTVSRALTAAVVVLAAAGAIRLWRARSLSRAPLILALTPLLLFAAGNYDGEMLFRIYLFAVPFLAFLAAHVRWVSTVARLAVGAVVLGAFLIAYYGKDREYYFTHEEVAASTYLATHAPPNTLLVDGTRNYPAQFKNYERFYYVTLSREPADSRARILARPAAVLADWTRDRRFRKAFVIITRSQKVEVDEMGSLPRGSLARVERALLRSPSFRVAYRNRDAVIFEPVAQAARTGSRG